MEETAQQTPVILPHFAPHQIERLNAVGALINHRNSCVTRILFHAIFTDIAVPAMDLHRQIGNIKAHIGLIRLNHGGQQSHQIIRFLTFYGVRVLFGNIEIHANPIGEGARAFTKCLGCQQHFPHIWVHNNGVCGFIREFDPVERAHLQTVARIGEAVLPRYFSQPQTLHRNAKSRSIHHGKHGTKTFMGFTDQPADRIVKIHDAGGRCFNPHFVFN